jgi:hypothetical protein
MKKQNDDDEANTGGFAAALRTVQLKKTNKVTIQLNTKLSRKICLTTALSLGTQSIHSCNNLAKFLIIHSYPSFAIVPSVELISLCMVNSVA